MIKSKKSKWYDFDDDVNYGYRKTEAFIFGLFLLIMSLFLFSEKEYTLYHKIIFASYRAVCIPWVTFIADKQNKSKLAWGLIASIFPSITLMVIAKSNKK